MAEEIHGGWESLIVGHETRLTVAVRWVLTCRLIVAFDNEKGLVWIKWLGTRTRVSEILNRKRALSVAMIRRGHAELGIAAEVLI